MNKILLVISYKWLFNHKKRIIITHKVLLIKKNALNYKKKYCINVIILYIAIYKEKTKKI
jgi:hypothetical protein